MGYVIFDMDGVLFDSEHLDHECWHRTAEAMGLHDPDNVFYRSIGRPRGDIYRELNGEYGEAFDAPGFIERTLECFDAYIEEHGMPLKYYAAECLAGFKSAGAVIGLASSTSADRVRAQLTATGLIGYFDDIVGGGMFVHGKPDPEIFEMSCRRLGGVASEAFVIEDSYNGIRAAHAAGMKPIMVPDMVMPDDEIKPLCHKICRDLKEVLDTLKGLMG